MNEVYELDIEEVEDDILRELYELDDTGGRRPMSCTVLYPCD